MDLVLDFNTDPAGSGVWKRVTATQAKGMKAKVQAGNRGTMNVTDGELEGMLGS